MTRSRHIQRPRKPWTDRDLKILRREYPDVITALIAKKLGRRIYCVYQQAAKLGLKKSDAFNALPASGRMLPSDTRGAPTRFKPGQIPPNKGLRRPGWAPGRMSETQFKKGRLACESSNYVALGTLRLSKDGYLERKVTDDPALVPARRWVAIHRLVWIDANGPMPPGHAVAFKAGQRTDVLEQITVDRLELVSRAELMRRNSYHTRYPKEIGLVIQLRGAVQRQINRRERLEKQD